MIERRMMEGQVRQVLASIDKDNPVLVAVRSVLADAHDAHDAQLCERSVTSEDRHYDAGAAAALKGVDDVIESIWKEEQEKARAEAKKL